MWSFSMHAGVAMSDVSGHRSGCQMPPRRSALAQWMNAVSTSTTMATLACIPSIGQRSSTSGSTLIEARPFTRIVSSVPGTMNSSATAPSDTMLRIESRRLFPDMSGMARR